jgi:prepilin-type N-terminal cleavage/methylation domain-containing protein
VQTKSFAQTLPPLTPYPFAAIRAIRGSAFPVSAFRSPVSSSSAFTLLEVLVATAVLALMMAFLFNLLGSSTKLWEVGNKKIEAAQAARVGLNIIASDLKNAFAGNMTSYSSNGSLVYNVAPFLGVDSSNTAITGTLTGDATVVPGSDQLFGVRLTSDSSNPYEQFGYQCVYVTNTGGFENMRDKRYYLVSQNIPDAFYYRGGSPTSAWTNNTTSSQNSPIVDNCIRVTFRYYGNQTSLTSQTSSNGTRSFTSNGTWPSNATTAHLPLGVLVTITVVDSNTAEKIRPPLTESDITAGINAALGLGNANESIVNQRLIRQGSETMSRFIPFNAN